MDNEQNNGGGFQKREYDVDLQCKDCGTKITKLPFQPRDGSSVSCRDCYRKNRPPRNFSR